MSGFRFDPYSPEVQADPFPWLDTLLAEHPVWPDPDGRWWAVARYEDVRTIVSDYETFKAGEGVVLDMDVADFPPILTAVDPPQHTRMRKAVAGWFTARHVSRSSRTRSGPRRTASSTSSATSERSTWWRRSAGGCRRERSPTTSASRADLPAFQGWLAKMIGDLSSPESLQAMAASGAYIADAMQHRRTAPGDDLLTACANAEVDGDPLPENEKLGLAWLLLVGGLEATTFHLANTAARLAHEADLRDRLVADPGLVPAALEEILRHDAPVQGDLRTCTRDVRLAGTDIPAGAKVLFLLGAANRDPAVFDRAGEVVYDRSPNPHLAFGGGVHFCIGAALARIETTVAVQELLGRYPGLTAAGPARRSFTNTSFMYGLASLPVELISG